MGAQRKGGRWADQTQRVLGRGKEKLEPRVGRGNRATEGGRMAEEGGGRGLERGAQDQH